MRPGKGWHYVPAKRVTTTTALAERDTPALKRKKKAKRSGKKKRPAQRGKAKRRTKAKRKGKARR